MNNKIGGAYTVLMWPTLDLGHNSFAREHREPSAMMKLLLY